jgi:hypothetical protein
MRCMSPQSTTTNPAPAAGTTLAPGGGSRGAVQQQRSWDSDRCVFAMHTGAVPIPSDSMRAMSFSACGR